jgi:uncharacterized protein YbjT (DUF2867 family)
MTTRNLGRTTILVAGATGTVGSEVVKQLSSTGQNVRVRATVRSINKAAKIKAVGAEIAEIDYTKPTTLTKAFSGVDKLFLNTPFQPDMVELTSNLVSEAAKSGTVEHIVKLSVLDAEDEPGIMISRIHRQAEKNIEDSGIPFTFLRASGFMQNFVNIYSNSIKSRGAVYTPAGNGKLGFVDVRDIAAVAVKVLTENGSRHQNKAYGLTGPEALSYTQAAEILSDEIGRRISYVDVPEEDGRKGMKQVGMESWLIDAVMELYNRIKAGHESKTTTVVEQITGRKPISFAQFAKDNVGFFK